MSKQHSNVQTILFVGVMAVISAFLLSFAATALKSKQEANARLDMQRNILKAMGMIAAKEKTPEGRQLPFKNTAAEVATFVDEYVESVVVDKDGNLAQLPAGKTITDLKAEDEKKKLTDNDPANDATALLPVYILKGDGGQGIEAYVIPIEGKGLWSTLYGFLALQGDLNTVRGITFYKHGETPGLGGEVENVAWQAQWTGTYEGAHEDGWEKKILDGSGQLVSVTVKKGGAARDNSHAVDGLAGATMTSNGVTTFLKADLELYQPYFNRVRSGD